MLSVLQVNLSSISIEKVVDEITAMYTEAGLKLDVFHTGGDEVPEGAWTKSPLAAESVENNILKSETQKISRPIFS